MLGHPGASGRDTREEAALRAHMKELEEKNSEIRRELSRLKTKNARLQLENAELKEKLEEKDIMIRKLTKCYERVRTQLRVQLKHVRSLNRAMASLAREARKMAGSMLNRMTNVLRIVPAFVARMREIKKKYRSANRNPNLRFYDADVGYPPQVGTISDYDDETVTEAFPTSDEDQV